MTEPIYFKLNNREVRIFTCKDKNAPIIYINNFFEQGEEILQKCSEIDCPPFTMVSISHLRWDEDLSPWPHLPVISPDDDFTGGADNYCKWMINELIPKVLEKIDYNPKCRIIAGYSMGGLFALFTPYLTDYFSAIMAASGSVWYPGFLNYVKTHPFNKKNKPKAIYLSVGNLETFADNPVVSQTHKIMKELLAYYQSVGIDSIFQLNKGNHYHQPNLRMAKGIKWILENLKK